MTAWVDVSDEVPPEGGMLLPPLEARGFADLPKTVSGEIRRTALRAGRAQGHGGAAYRKENQR
ncbi:hypothetical protein GCM10010211_07080 [Streptomyces albospinus]|uniref:Uncharacterized protein n=1 Tax=Streptomyces albospinus TaxID=285515 RepID=A0ABQ2UNR9_9ACTN|nr:hypothetical protein [Streptomyces albospinus]GGU46166.1 hypothetical protein GCM10010211_07080 [Streptomyces albospinus]